MSTTKNVAATGTPPRSAVRLIEWRFSAEDAEAIIGDLTEEFGARRSQSGDRSARRWFWRQALGSLVARRRDLAPETTGTGSNVLSSVAADLRFGLRSLRRAPGFAVAAIATLSLGIGAATAVGTAASRTLLRPLPFPTGDRLIVAGDDSDGSLGNVGFETALDWRARVTSLDELAIIRGWQPTLTRPDGAVRINGERVSWNYFRMLGVQLQLGRDFEKTDDTPDNWRVVILSDGLWRRQFGGSPSVIGTSIDFNGRTYLVAGVLPASFEPLIEEKLSQGAEIWAPLGYAIGGDSSCRSCRHLRSVGRLRAGVTIAQASAELATVHAGLRREHPNDYTEAPPHMVMLHDLIAESMARPMQLLMGAVGFVLLVACANVAGLLIARSSDRTREMALRSALGASRGRLMRQLVVESTTLALVSAGIGLALARGGLVLLAARAPLSIPRLDGAAGDPWLFGVAALVTLASLFACALIPALMSSRVSLESALRDGRQTATPGALRAREWLMAIEIAAALLVIAGGGLMYRTVGHLLRVDPGFRSDGVITAGLQLVGQRWAEDRDVRVFQTALLERVRSLPGVESAALAGQVPLGGDYDRRSMKVIGRPPVSEADEPSLERYSVTPDYFKVMRIPLKQGRWLTDTDRFETENVILIGETTAREVFPGESPIGKQVRFGSDRNPHLMTIVGIVGDVRHYSLATKPNPQFYSTQEQITDSFLTLVVKAAHPEQLAGAIRREVAALAPDVPIYAIAQLDDVVASSIATRSFLMVLLAALGGITLVLAGVGLYGVVSQGVAVRRRELGIRVALGASRSSVLTLIARRGVIVFIGGAVVGLAGAAGAGYAIQSQLYETRPLDPVTMISAVGALALVAVAAHFVPIRRALRTDPRETLRAD